MSAQFSLSSAVGWAISGAVDPVGFPIFAVGIPATGLITEDTSAALILEDTSDFIVTEV